MTVYPFNTTNLMPASDYYHKLLRQIDDAYWNGGTAKAMELVANDVKEHIERGDAWYPNF